MSGRYGAGAFPTWPARGVSLGRHASKTLNSEMHSLPRRRGWLGGLSQMSLAEWRMGMSRSLWLSCFLGAVLAAPAPGALAQLVCQQDRSRTVFAGDPYIDGGCGQFDGAQASCERAFELHDEGIVSCWYDPGTGECRGCSFDLEASLECVNTCAPPTCLDRSRTFAGGPGTAACRQFNYNQTACEAAFARSGRGAVTSCHYDPDGSCHGCVVGGECTNTCLPPPTCLDRSRTFAGGPGTAACHQFDDDQAACEAAFARSGEGFDVSCHYDYDPQEGGYCHGCNPHDENYLHCTNTCAPRPTCEGDTSRTFAGGGYGPGCDRLDGYPAACEAAFVRVGDDLLTTSCYVGLLDCVPCGHSPEGGPATLPEEQRGDDPPVGCLNTCVPPPTCVDASRTVFAGGPGTQACHQYDGNQAACETAYAQSGHHGVVTCWYNATYSRCSGCIPEDEAHGRCSNTCQPPPTCVDASRTVFAGGPGTQACHQYDGDQAACEAAFARSGEGPIVSCHYDPGTSSCHGCSPSREYELECTNTCEPSEPPVCEQDASRTVFAGGPGTQACHQFDDDQTTCEAAFARSGEGPIVSCHYDADGSCHGCSEYREAELECANTCDPPVCEQDASRTVFAGGPGTQACHQFDDDQTACEAAFARSGTVVDGEEQIVSCHYDSASGSCHGCSLHMQTELECSNSCDPPVCGQDPARSLSTCERFEGNAAACNQAFQLDSSGGPVSCVAVRRCSTCDLRAQVLDGCTNECLLPAEFPPPAPAPALSWYGLVASLLALAGLVAYRLRRTR